MDTIQEAEIISQLAALSQEVQRLEGEAKNADKFTIDALALLGNIIGILIKPMPTSVRESVGSLIIEIEAAIKRTSTKFPPSS